MAKKKCDCNEKLLRSKIEGERKQLNGYVSVLSDHGICEQANALFYFENLFKESQHSTNKRINESNISKEMKEELLLNSNFFFMKEECCQLKSNLSYYKSLVKMAESELRSLSIGVKKKIVRLSLEKLYLWSEHFNFSHRVSVILEEEKGK